MYDIIGDIHGRADELEALLLKLGYQRQGTVYKHPERKAIFVGDFIDGKGQHRKTVDICRSMVEQEKTLAVMGNHEFNAICYSIPEALGMRLCRIYHSLNNVIAIQIRCRCLLGITGWTVIPGF